MGCFSYLCKECGKEILSNSFRGEQVKLFYLQDGKVVEQMEGEYDSYGCVFIDGTQAEGVNHPLRQSRNWKNQEGISEAFDCMEFARRHKYWEDVEILLDECSALLGKEIYRPSFHCQEFKNDWGIAAVHSRCFKGVPTTISENDPNQGWGESGELLFDISDTLDIEEYGRGK
jgi:hypothetical protein